jgi:septum formation protein
MPDYRLRLASTSPRRRALLPLLGFPVETSAVDIDESPLPGEPPAETARRLSQAKASARGAPDGDEVVVGSDTIVVAQGGHLGKPADAADARSMLARLRGGAHEVVSGVALVAGNGRHRGAVRTTVRMRAYSDDEIERYVASGRPLDKAGAYAIQDVDFGPVERIEGCYLNVVGLPLCEVSRGLRALGWPLPAEEFRPPCRLCWVGEQVVR